MKSKLLICALVLGASAGFGFAQGFTTTQSDHRAATTLPVKPSPSPAITRGGRGGVVPTILRHRNPLQMLNPGAPAEYGTAQEHTSYDPREPGKPKGIKLFEWTF